MNRSLENCPINLCNCRNLIICLRIAPGRAAIVEVSLSIMPSRSGDHAGIQEVDHG